MEHKYFTKKRYVLTSYTDLLQFIHINYHKYMPDLAHPYQLA